MDVVSVSLPGVKIIQPKVFGDARGYFFESYSKERYLQAGISGDFVQDNLSSSSKGILRGLHFQNPTSQGKLVSVLLGEVFDVVVDVRKGSPNFGEWFGVTLSSENKSQLWIPAGFAHGFLVTSDQAIFAYKCDAYYSPSAEFTLLWNDPDIKIRWPLDEPSLSKKDLNGRRLLDFKDHELPTYKGDK